MTNKESALHLLVHNVKELLERLQSSVDGGELILSIDVEDAVDAVKLATEAAKRLLTRP